MMMESMLWNHTTAEQAMALEDAGKNPFLPGSLHSEDYFVDLNRRREQYPLCSLEKRQEFLQRFQSEKVSVYHLRFPCSHLVPRSPSLSEMRAVARPHNSCSSSYLTNGCMMKRSLAALSLAPLLHLAQQLRLPVRWSFLWAASLDAAPMVTIGTAAAVTPDSNS